MLGCCPKIESSTERNPGCNNNSSMHNRISTLIPGPILLCVPLSVAGSWPSSIVYILPALIVV